MKIIFLDLDGCIVTQKTKWKDFHPDCVAALKKILDNTNAKIVLSSCWRHGFVDRTNPAFPMIHRTKVIPVLKERFKKWGLPPESLIDVTPDFRVKNSLDNEFPSDHRGSEITMWLNKNSKHFEVESFVILDDDLDMEPHNNRLVQTVEPEGLTMENADQAIKLLTKDKNIV